MHFSEIATFGRLIYVESALKWKAEQIMNCHSGQKCFYPTKQIQVTSKQVVSSWDLRMWNSHVHGCFKAVYIWIVSHHTVRQGVPNSLTPPTKAKGVAMPWEMGRSWKQRFTSQTSDQPDTEAGAVQIDGFQTYAAQWIVSIQQSRYWLIESNPTGHAISSPNRKESPRRTILWAMASKLVFKFKWNIVFDIMFL